MTLRPQTSRFSDPYLNRFLQPDTIVPNLFYPQTLNRYSYVLNRPINYSDPTGHKACADYTAEGKCFVDPDWHPVGLAYYGVTTSGTSDQTKKDTLRSVEFTAAALIGAPSSHNFTSLSSFFRAIMGKVTLTINGNGGGEGCLTTYLENNESKIECNQNTDMSIGTITHELFHVFDKRYQAFSTVDDVVHPNGPNPGCANCLASNYVSQDWMANNNGFKCDDYSCVAHPSWLSGYDTSELFADMGENWALGEAKIDPANYGFQNQLGVDMNKWMNDNTPWFLGNMGF